MPLHACTIVSSPTSVQGLVLARTFLAHNPEAGVTIVAVGDAYDRLAGRDEPGLTVLDAASLPGVELDLLGAVHAPAQLREALVPHAARLLLGEHERLLVLAPWTRVAAPLDEVERALDGAPVVCCRA